MQQRTIKMLRYTDSEKLRYRLNCQFSIRRRSIISCFSLFLFYVALFNLTLQIWHLRHFLAQIYGRIAAEYSKKYRKNVIYRPQN